MWNAGPGTWLRMWTVVAGGLFIWASIAKGIDASGLYDVLRYFQVPAGARTPLVLMLLAAEAGTGITMMCLRTRTAAWFGVGLLTFLSMVLLSLVLSGNAAPGGGCFGGKSTGAASENLIALLRNLGIISTGAVLLFFSGDRRRSRVPAPSGHRSPLATAVAAKRPSGFTIVEVLVVILILIALLSLLMPTLISARRQATSTACLARLSQIGAAFHRYANEYGGWIPREGDPHPWNFDRHKPWPIVLHREWAWFGPVELARAAVKERMLKCPGNPDPDAHPVTYEVNAFAFSDRYPLGSFEVQGPMKITEVRRPTDVILVKDVIGYDYDTRFPPPSVDLATGPYWPGYWEVARVDWLPAPVGKVPLHNRYTHHPNRFNAVFFDGHAREIRTSELKLAMFDDGIRSHPNRTPIPRVAPKR